ncbi:MAG TPA: alpha/beta hydrolase [Longimicrobiales bacterium]|nr:alpha/beta hydrolase [Longimicrobiales bacterium]
MTRGTLIPTLLSLGVLAGPVWAQNVPAPGAFVGAWTGRLDTGAATLTLVFHVAQARGGGFEGTLDSPDQGATGIPATEVTVDEGTLRFAVANLAVTYVAALSADGSTLTGTFTQGPAPLPLTLTRGEAEAPKRPQNPTLPLPYRSVGVTVPNAAAGVTLAGTLTLPDGPGPFPAAVLVTGSGPQDRDETLLGHKPFLVLSDHLTRAGIAVLRYDDRGTGESTGSFATATSEDLASDALAAVAFLRARRDMGAVGIVGHSEGGLVGPMAAARSADVAFVVMLAGPGLPGRRIIQLQSELIGRAEGESEAMVRLNAATQAKLFDIVAGEPDPQAAAPLLRAALQEASAGLPREQATPEAMDAQVRQVNSPWFRFFLTYDPRPTLAQVEVPVLALNGSLDLQVPAEVNLREVGAALARGHNPDATTRMLPGLNHLFQRAETGAPSEYAKIQETMNPAALDAVTSWILARFARPRPTPHRPPFPR